VKLIAGKYFGKFWILMLITLSGYAHQSDSSRIQIPILDLSDGWMESENGKFKLIPFNKKSNAIHFYITKNNLTEGDFHIQLPALSSLWIDNRLVEFYKNDTTFIFSANQLMGENSERLISIYGKNLSRNNLRTTLMKTTFKQEREISNRQQNSDRQFLLISFLLGLTITAIFNMNTHGTLQEYFSINRTFNLRNREELMFKSKLFSAPNPIFYLVVSYLSSFMVVSLLLLTPDSFSLKFTINTYTTWQLMVFQILIMGGFYIWIVFKWMLVRYIGGLFRLSEFSTIHFFNYERFSFIFLLFMTSCLIACFFAFGNETFIYSFMVSIIVLAASSRIILMLFKLLNGSSYKFLHLFSYLCATEIIPYLFAIKLILI
jgi:hypothetical protein